MLSPSKQEHPNQYTTPKVSKNGSKDTLNIPMLSEYITTGFKSLNEAMKQLKTVNNWLQEKKELAKELKKPLKDVYTHLKLGERSMYLVFESGMLKWADDSFEGSINSGKKSSTRNRNNLDRSDVKRLVNEEIGKFRQEQECQLDFNQFYGATGFSNLENVNILQTQNSALAGRIEVLEKENSKLKKKVKKALRKGKKTKPTNENQTGLLSQFINRSRSNSAHPNKNGAYLETLPKSKLIEMISTQNFTLKSSKPSKSVHSGKHFESTTPSTMQIQQSETGPYFVNSSFSQKLDNPNKQWASGLRSVSRKRSKSRGSRRNNLQRTGYLDSSQQFSQLSKQQLVQRQDSLDQMQKNLNESHQVFKKTLKRDSKSRSSFSRTKNKRARRRKKSSKSRSNLRTSKSRNNRTKETGSFIQSTESDANYGKDHSVYSSNNHSRGSYSNTLATSQVKNRKSSIPRPPSVGSGLMSQSVTNFQDTLGPIQLKFSQEEVKDVKKWSNASQDIRKLYEELEEVKSKLQCLEPIQNNQNKEMEQTQSSKKQTMELNKYCGEGAEEEQQSKSSRCPTPKFEDQNKFYDDDSDRKPKFNLADKFARLELQPEFSQIPTIKTENTDYQRRSNNTMAVSKTSKHTKLSSGQQKSPYHLLLSKPVNKNKDIPDQLHPLPPQSSKSKHRNNTRLQSLQDPFLTNQNTITSTTQYYLEKKPHTLASQFDSMVNEIEDLIPQKRSKNIFNTESLLEVRNRNNSDIVTKEGKSRVSVAESQPQPFVSSKLYQFKTMQDHIRIEEEDKENDMNLLNLNQHELSNDFQVISQNENRKWKIQNNLKEYKHMRTRLKRSISRSRDNSLKSESTNQNLSNIQFNQFTDKSISTINNQSLIAQKSGQKTKQKASREKLRVLLEEKMAIEGLEHDEDGNILLDDIRQLDDEISGIKNLLLKNGIGL